MCKIKEARCVHILSRPCQRGSDSTPQSFQVTTLYLTVKYSNLQSQMIYSPVMSHCRRELKFNLKVHENILTTSQK